MLDTLRRRLILLLRSRGILLMAYSRSCEILANSHDYIGCVCRRAKDGVAQQFELQGELVRKMVSIQEEILRKLEASLSEVKSSIHDQLA